MEVQLILPHQLLAPFLIFSAFSIDAKLIQKNLNLKSALAAFVLMSSFQFIFFKSVKNQNIYDTLTIQRNTKINIKELNILGQNLLYTQILDNPERLIFYEKYHEVTNDLNIIRSFSFQNEKILKSLNFYLILLMLSVIVTKEKEFYSSRNLILSLIFLGFVYEAQLILNNGLEGSIFDYFTQNNFTLKEQVLLLRILFFNFLLIIKNLLRIISVPQQKKVLTSLEQFEEITLQIQKKNEDNQQMQKISKLSSSIRDNLEKIIKLENQEQDGFFSSKNLNNALTIMTLFMLFTGNYEE